MLRFDVYRNGQPASAVSLKGAYAFGADDIPVRADLVASGHQITCMRSAAGAFGLALPWSAGGNGTYLLATTRLPEHREAYNLNVELARGQLMRLYRKREDWALFDYPGAESLNEQFNHVQSLFIDALSTQPTDPAGASKLADESLNEALLLGEKFSLYHADILINKRISTGGRCLKMGISVQLDAGNADYMDRLDAGLEFLHLPTPWPALEVVARMPDYTVVDGWVNWAARREIGIHAGPILDFRPDGLPTWLLEEGYEFDALRRELLAHLQQIIERYADQVDTWTVLSGINAHNPCGLTFDQITDLSRAAFQLARQIAPEATLVLDLAQPWGEYYARNQRTIPPMLFADLACQNDMKFDAFGVPVQLGKACDGHYVRDLMQISSMLEEFLPYGKSVRLTACGVPSSAHGEDSQADQPAVTAAGQWHAPWSQRLQAEWLHALFRMAMSKPYIASLCWTDLADSPEMVIPQGGLCSASMQPKIAYREFHGLRQSMGKLKPTNAARAGRQKSE